MNPRKLKKLMDKLGFPRGQWVQEGDGLVARFDSRDRLTTMYWAEENEPVGRQLTLDHNLQHGQMRMPWGSGGTEDSEIYKDGAWERFDAWSDNTRPRPMKWSDWIIEQVTSFAASCRCVLCGDQLIKSPPAAYSPCERNFLCAPCYRWTQKGSPTKRAWPLGQRLCSQCDHVNEDMAPMFEGRRAKLCAVCAPDFQPR